MAGCRRVDGKQGVAGGYARCGVSCAALWHRWDLFKDVLHCCTGLGGFVIESTMCAQFRMASLLIYASRWCRRESMGMFSSVKCE